MRAKPFINYFQTNLNDSETKRSIAKQWSITSIGGNAQDIMVAEFTNTNILFKMMKTTTKIPRGRVS